MHESPLLVSRVFKSKNFPVILTRILNVLVSSFSITLGGDKSYNVGTLAGRIGEVTFRGASKTIDGTMATDGHRKEEGR